MDGMGSNEIRTTAWEYRANLIETGTLILTASDIAARAAAETNARLKKEWESRARPLGEDQKKTIADLRRLAVLARDGKDDVVPGSDEASHLSFGLQCWANNVETGNPLLSRADVQERMSGDAERTRIVPGGLRSSSPGLRSSRTSAKTTNSIRTLDPEQTAFVARLRRMAAEIDGRVRKDVGRGRD